MKIKSQVLFRSFVSMSLATIALAGCRGADPELTKTQGQEAISGRLDGKFADRINTKGTIRGTKAEAPIDWQGKDPDSDDLAGSRAEKAYAELVTQVGKTIIVAVIDSGIDINHEDLKGRIWVNEKEAKGKTGIDDDGDGYIDNVHGWNFIGGKDGRHVAADTLETTREYKRLGDKKAALEANGQTLSSEELALYHRVEKETTEGLTSAKTDLANWTNHLNKMNAALKVLETKLGLKNPTVAQVEAIKSSDKSVLTAKDSVLFYLTRGFDAARLGEAKQHASDAFNFHYNVDFDPRATIVRDNPADLNEKFYGNGDVQGPDAEHGTHVAGTIAALRSNKFGGKGIAENVKIMALRAVPNGDERDKDIANAVRFATDHGAHIISMSFGKKLSPNKDLVDAAFRYAESKGLLLVHAAGNDAKDNDRTPSFPNATIKSGGALLDLWIEVGASTRFADERLPADFSNYGQSTVDLFGPGHEIYAPVPGNKYASLSGTSMATPVVSGVAALIWSQYPTLSAAQVKKILLSSVRDYGSLTVLIPDDSADPNNRPTGSFEKLSRTGGIVDAYAALQAAALIQK